MIVLLFFNFHLHVNQPQKKNLSPNKPTKAAPGQNRSRRYLPLRRAQSLNSVPLNKTIHKLTIKPVPRMLQHPHQQPHHLRASYQQVYNIPFSISTELDEKGVSVANLN